MEHLTENKIVRKPFKYIVVIIAIAKYWGVAQISEAPLVLQSSAQILVSSSASSLSYHQFRKTNIMRADHVVWEERLLINKTENPSKDALGKTGTRLD